MAPRRGGGGGGWYSSSSSVCPDAFSSATDGPLNSLPEFIRCVVFLVVALILLIAWIWTRKRHEGAKKLLGWVYGSVIVCWLLASIFDMCARLAVECYVENYVEVAHKLAVVFIVFNRISIFLLLVVLVWTLPSLLYRQLGSATLPTKIRITSLASLAVMTCLTFAWTAIMSYNEILWIEPSTWNRRTGRWEREGPRVLWRESEDLGLAYNVLYLCVVLSAGVVSIKATSKGKETGAKVGALRGKTITLVVCMALCFIWSIIEGALFVAFVLAEGLEVSIFRDLRDIFYTAVLVVLLKIGKSDALKPGYQQAQVTPMTTQSQPGYGQVQQEYLGARNQPVYDQAKPNYAVQSQPLYGQSQTQPAYGGQTTYGG